jgi:hypothetical protein
LRIFETAPPLRLMILKTWHPCEFDPHFHCDAAALFQRAPAISAYRPDV